MKNAPKREQQHTRGGRGGEWRGPHRSYLLWCRCPVVRQRRSYIAGRGQLPSPPLRPASHPLPTLLPAHREPEGAAKAVPQARNYKDLAWPPFSPQARHCAARALRSPGPVRHTNNPSTTPLLRRCAAAPSSRGSSRRPVWRLRRRPPRRNSSRGGA